MSIIIFSYKKFNLKHLDVYKLDYNYDYHSLTDNINNEFSKKSIMGLGFSYFKKGSLLENSKKYSDVNSILKYNKILSKENTPKIKKKIIEKEKYKYKYIECKNNIHYKKDEIYKNRDNEDNSNENYIDNDVNEINILNISKDFPMKKINYFSNYSTYYLSNENNENENDNENEDNKNDNINNKDKFSNEILEVKFFS